MIYPLTRMGQGQIVSFYVHTSSNVPIFLANYMLDGKEYCKHVFEGLTRFGMNICKGICHSSIIKEDGFLIYITLYTHMAS